MPVYADAHCHLHHPSMRSQLETLLADKKKVHLVCAGISSRDWPQLLKLQRDMQSKHPHSCIECCFGIHPWEAANISASPDALAEAEARLESVLRDQAPSAAAVGEIGLDRAWLARQTPPCREQLWDTQKQLLAMQLSAAQRWQLPAVLHCVKAHGTMQEMLRKVPTLPPSFLHGFYGPPEALRIYADLKLYVSFSTAQLLKDWHSLDWQERGKPRWQTSADALPLNRILLESDSGPQADGSPSPPRRADQAAMPLAELYRCSADDILEQAGLNLASWLHRR
ncbi:TatD family hydrolase [bacterium]|nr:TatD family hydrolase [bacterium]